MTTPTPRKSPADAHWLMSDLQTTLLVPATTSQIPNDTRLRLYEIGVGMKQLISDLAARDAELAAMKEAHAEQLRAVLARELVYANAQTAMKQRAVAAEQERDSAVSWNHRVSVCEKHTAEIVDGPCVICELEAAERKAEEAARILLKINQALLPDPHDERDVSPEWQVKAIRAAIAAEREA